MTEHKFFMAMNPPTATHQEKKSTMRNGKHCTYKPDNLIKAERLFKDHLSQFIPKEKFSGPLMVHTKWMFPIPKTMKWVHGDWKTTKPDSHNMPKLPFDIMTDLGYWTDDSIVAQEIIEKVYWDTPGVWVHIKKLPRNAVNPDLI